MKPYQTLFFLLSVFISLFLIMLVFPEEGIPVTRNFNLRFKNFDDFLDNERIEYADIQGIIKNYEDFETTEEILEVQNEQPGLIKDSSIHHALVRKIPKCPMELSPDNIRILYPIFEDLYLLPQRKNLIRILHYGDSQIETDRITSFLRNEIQTLFGGSGCGLISPGPFNIGSTSFIQKYSQNWKRYTGYVNPDSTLDHKKFGAMFSFIQPDKLAAESSWLSFSPSSVGYKKSKIFNNLSLYLTNTLDSVSFKIFVNDSLFDSQILIPYHSLSKLTWQFNSTPGDLTLLIEGKGRPGLYGISFDATRGVAVDNIPLRGSSGLVFSKTDTVFLHEMYRELNVRMIILQFGGNIVPMNADDYSFYETYFRRELTLIKRILPDVPVIVIGPSDMSVKEDDKLVTYPSVIKVRDALKNATLGSGYAFWDMFEAMGGENSMPGWVYADPPLAIPDFVHFTTRGAKLIGEMFYDAFIYDYYRWLETEKSDIRK